MAASSGGARDQASCPSVVSVSELCFGNPRIPQAFPGMLSQTNGVPLRSLQKRVLVCACWLVCVLAQVLANKARATTFVLLAVRRDGWVAQPQVWASLRESFAAPPSNSHMGTPSTQTANLPSLGQPHPQGSQNGQQQQPSGQWSRWQNPDADKEDRRTIIQNSESLCFLQSCLWPEIGHLYCTVAQSL